jgi:pseudouridine-5'-monophosphatase
MGKPERESAAHLLSFFPGIDLTIDDYLLARDAAQNARWPTVPLMPGAKRLIEHLHKNNVPMAIATGTRRSAYEIKTSQLQDVFSHFGSKVVCADDGVIGMGRGKPHPDIYLWAAKHLLKRDVGDITASESELSEAYVQARARGLVFEVSDMTLRSSLSF